MFFSEGLTFVGYLLITAGLVAFSYPQQPHNTTSTPILINNLLALSGATLTTLFFTQFKPNYWKTTNCLQGSLSGIISIAAGVDIYHPIAAFTIAIGAASLRYLFFELIQRTYIEDYCNAVATHVICGMFGALMPTVLGRTENPALFTVGFKACMVHMTWQLVCTLSVSVLVVIVFAAVFSVLMAVRLLRNQDEVESHKRAVAVYR